MEGETTSLPGASGRDAFPARGLQYMPRQQFTARTKRAPFAVRVEQRQPVQSSFAGASHSLHLPIVPTCLAGAPPDPNPSVRSRRDRSLQRGEVRKKEWRRRPVGSSCVSCTRRGRGEWRRPQLRWWRHAEGDDRCVLRPPW